MDYFFLGPDFQDFAASNDAAGRRLKSAPIQIQSIYIYIYIYIYGHIYIYIYIYIYRGPRAFLRIFIFGPLMAPFICNNSRIVGALPQYAVPQLNSCYVPRTSGSVFCPNRSMVFQTRTNTSDSYKTGPENTSVFCLHGPAVVFVWEIRLKFLQIRIGFTVTLSSDDALCSV